MKELLNFFIEVGKLKRIKRKGWILRGIKDPETIAAHTFRMTLMAWILSSKKKINLEKILKMSLIHDICETYAGDTTPYDKLLSKNKSKWKEITDRWPRFSKDEKKEIFLDKYKKEDRALNKIVSKLPQNLKREIINLWNDYEKGLTQEGRFLRQLDRIENLLQALEYWHESKRFKIRPWWIQIEELVDDPVLIEFMKFLDQKFHEKHKRCKK